MDNEWIKWDGVAFAPPIDPDWPVEVRFVDGTEGTADSRSFDWQWEDPDNPKYYDIEAFRFVKA